MQSFLRAHLGEGGQAPSPRSHLEFFSQSGEETLRHSSLAILWHLGGDIPDHSLPSRLLRWPVPDLG